MGKKLEIARQQLADIQIELDAQRARTEAAERRAIEAEELLQHPAGMTPELAAVFREAGDLVARILAEAEHPAAASGAPRPGAGRARGLARPARVAGRPVARGRRRGPAGDRGRRRPDPRGPRARQHRADVARDATGQLHAGRRRRSGRDRRPSRPGIGRTRSSSTSRASTARPSRRPRRGSDPPTAVRRRSLARGRRPARPRERDAADRPRREPRLPHALLRPDAVGDDEELRAPAEHDRPRAGGDRAPRTRPRRHRQRRDGPHAGDRVHVLQRLRAASGVGPAGDAARRQRMDVRVGLEDVREHREPHARAAVGRVVRHPPDVRGPRPRRARGACSRIRTTATA